MNTTKKKEELEQQQSQTVPAQTKSITIPAQTGSGQVQYDVYINDEFSWQEMVTFTTNG